MKKILIINGHPYDKSLCTALADAYERGARSGGRAEVKRINLYDLKFDPILHKGYHEIQELEPDLKMAQEAILWSDHIVFVYPTWWLDVPALLKGFVDRIFLPGFAFKYEKNRLLPKKLLAGRTDHLIITMDAPRIYSWLMYGDGMHHAFHKGTLGFCGLKTTGHTFFDRVKNRNEEEIQKWIKKVEHLGYKLK